MRHEFTERASRDRAGKFPLVAAALAVGLMWLACAGCQTNPRAEARSYAASGQRYLKQKKFRDAAIEFRNALQKDPEDWRARYRLARLENQMHQWRGCFQDLKRVVSQQPSFVPARLDLAELYIAADQYRLAQHQIDRSLRLSPNNVRAELAQMKLYLTHGSLDQAAKQCATLRRIAPSDDQIFAMCGLADVGRKQYEKAEQSFRVALRLGPDHAENYRNLSNALELEGKAKQAEALLNSGVQSHPNSLALALSLANFYVQHGRLQDADRLFGSLRARRKQFPKLLVTLGDFWMWRNELPRAIIEYRAAEKALPSELIEKNLASAYLTLHQIAQARRYTNDVLRRDPQSTDAQALEGAIDYLQGDYSHAGRLLETARKNNPASLLANFYLGMTWLATGQTDRAKQAFNECIQENSKFVQAYVRLGQIALESNDWRLGAEFAQKALAVNPGTLNGYLLLAQADMMQGDLRSAGRVIAVAEKEPQPSQALQQVAIRYDILQQDFPQAERQFTQMTTGARQSSALISWYANQLVSAGQTPRAIDDVRAWLARSPQNPATIELLARLYFLEGHLGPAESSIRRSLAEDPTGGSALQLLGEILQRQGQTARAAREYDAAIHADPGDVETYLLAGNLRMRQGRYAQAQSYFESARIEAPSSDATELAMVRCWAAQDTRLDQSLSLAQDLKAKYPRNGAVADVLGWIYHERGVDSLALPQLEMAASALPVDSIVRFHLGMTLAALKKQTQARSALDLALKLGLPTKEQSLAKHRLRKITVGNAS